MDTALWSGVAVLLSSVIVYAGTRYTARASKKASDYTSMLNAPETISTGYARLTDDLWSSIRDLRVRVGVLEGDAVIAEAKYHNAIVYVRVLLSFIAEHVPHVAPPKPPKDLGEDVR